MQIRWFAAPWHNAAPSLELRELEHALSGWWADACTEFFAAATTAERFGARGPKGVQRFLNSLLDARMTKLGWDGNTGRYVKSDSWVRFTFRHQMSIGSDHLDAIRAVRKEDLTSVAIVAAPSDLLEVISPLDKNVLCSFEKHEAIMREMNGAMDEIPLFLGSLEAQSYASREIDDYVRAPRNRL